MVVLGNEQSSLGGIARSMPKLEDQLFLALLSYSLTLSLNIPTTKAQGGTAL